MWVEVRVSSQGRFYEYAFSAATRELQNYALKHATVHTSHNFKTNHTSESTTRVHKQACNAYFQS